VNKKNTYFDIVTRKTINHELINVYPVPYLSKKDFDSKLEK